MSSGALLYRIAAIIAIITAPESAALSFFRPQLSARTTNSRTSAISWYTRAAPDGGRIHESFALRGKEISAEELNRWVARSEEEFPHEATHSSRFDDSY